MLKLRYELHAHDSCHLLCLLFDPLFHIVMTDYRKWDMLSDDEHEEQRESEKTLVSLLAQEAHSDLMNSLAWMRDKEIILIGECSHGTLDFYEYRCLMTRHLIEEGSIKSVCIEADW